MDRSEDELEQFKSRINLSAYAAAAGYELDRRASCRTSAAMKHPGGDIGVGADGHWLYFSVRDPADHGSIIDFIQNRRGLNLGQVRRELRSWLNGPPAPPPHTNPPSPTALLSPTNYAADLAPVTKDVEAVRRRLAGMRPVDRFHPYLVEQRAIPPQLLRSPRLSGRVLTDDRGNAVFPHWDQHGPCGYEAKNVGFTGFAPGGIKGLWAVGKEDGDKALVIAETAIDAISYAAIHGPDGMRLVSIAGAMNPQQPALLRRAMENMPPGSDVVAAVDHDAGGDAIAEQIEAVFEGTRREDLGFRRHSPPAEGRDWNDRLRVAAAGPRPPLPD